MHAIQELKMLAVGVNDMPKAKEFYADALGLKILSDYRQDDSHWWVSLGLPQGGITITLTTYGENATPGVMTLWFATSDLEAAHTELTDKGIDVSPIGDDLHGPGSGVKWFNFKDLEGNLIHIEQA